MKAKVTKKQVKKVVPKKSAKNIYMVRSYAAGVFFGEIVKRKMDSGVLVVDMKNARRVWYWEGAASLSQLAMEGSKNPEECKFPCAVDEVTLVNVVEIIKMRKEAIETLNKVPIWKA